jgi:hypothetical protein
VLDAIHASSRIASSRAVLKQNKPKVGQSRFMMVVDQDVRLTNVINTTHRQIYKTNYGAEVSVYDLDRV